MSEMIVLFLGVCLVILIILIDSSITERRMQRQLDRQDTLILDISADMARWMGLRLEDHRTFTEFDYWADAHRGGE